MMYIKINIIRFLSFFIWMFGLSIEKLKENYYLELLKYFDLIDAKLFLPKEIYDAHILKLKELIYDKKHSTFFEIFQVTNNYFRNHIEPDLLKYFEKYYKEIHKT